MNAFVFFNNHEQILPEYSRMKGSNYQKNMLRMSLGPSAYHVADEELDNYVAALIEKESEERKRKFTKLGIKAYTLIPEERYLYRHF